MCLLSFFILAQTWAMPSETPFWKSKEKAYARIQNREVLVVVKSDDKAGQKKRMLVQGGGQVEAPAKFVFKRAQDWSELPKLSGYIDSAVFDEKTSNLAVKMSAFGYRGDLKIHLEIRDKTEPLEITYSVTEGVLKDFHGRFWFTSLSENKSEVGMDGELLYDQFPVPKFFLEFGMEVVYQRMAVKLRHHAESEFKK